MSATPCTCLTRGGSWTCGCGRLRAKPRIFGALMHGPAAFLKSGRAVKATLEQLVQLPAARLNVSRGQAEVAALALKIRAHRAMALGLPVGV